MQRTNATFSPKKKKVISRCLVCAWQMGLAVKYMVLTLLQKKTGGPSRFNANFSKHICPQASSFLTQHVSFYLNQGKNHTGYYKHLRIQIFQQSQTGLKFLFMWVASVGLIPKLQKYSCNEYAFFSLFIVILILMVILQNLEMNVH